MTVGGDPLQQPIALGGLRLDRRLFMAPMAGITTPAFRAAVRRWGAGLVFTEMISAYGIHYDNRRTMDYLACGEADHPIGFQLFGADAAVLAGAAARCRGRWRRPRGHQHGLPGAQGDEDRRRRGAARRAGPRRRHRQGHGRRGRGPRPRDGQDPLGPARGRRGGAPPGAPPRRRRRRRGVRPPAHGGAALPGPRRPRRDRGPRRGPARPRDRLRGRGRPRRGPGAVRAAAPPP